MRGRLLLALAVVTIAVSGFGATAWADFVLRETLRPRDTDRSVRRAVRDVSDGAFAVDTIGGVHHPRTFTGKKNSRQANVATIYARVSGEVPGTALKLDRELLTFPCEQLEDGRWVCSARSVQIVVDAFPEIPQLFYLER